MTGEITLRGQVMPVGGIKEKVLAAHRSGLKTVILPKRNQADLEDLPEEVIDDINFIFVDTVDEVLQAALETPKSESKLKKAKTIKSSQRDPDVANADDPNE
jgi:ATP-dependent Lon protease